VRSIGSSSLASPRGSCDTLEDAESGTAGEDADRETAATEGGPEDVVVPVMAVESEAVAAAAVVVVVVVVVEALAAVGAAAKSARLRMCSWR
jgi:hypothetical protein